jgi:hypothetical protein
MLEYTKAFAELVESKVKLKDLKGSELEITPTAPLNVSLVY